MKNLISDYDLVIAGAGPAGLSAGVYAGRAGLKVLILEAEAPGGKVIKTDDVENYPGFDSIKGPELAMKFINQAMAQNCEFEYSGVEEFKKVDDLFEIILQSGKIITSKTFIIATGTKENKIGVPGEDELYGKGVSYCAVCDAAFYKEKDVAVVGGGYAAVEEGMYLTRFAKNVTIIHRRQGFRADDRTLEKAKANEKIHFVLDSVVTKISGETKVEKIEIENLVDHLKTELPVEAIFPFVGSYPITSFVKQNEILNEQKYIIVNEKMETSIKGLFAAGDVRVTPLRQIVTATSDGALAGQMAVEYIQHNS
jgi:thioredoxin reductase (NADPH)